MEDRIIRVADKVSDENNKEDEKLSDQISQVDGAMDETVAGLQKLYQLLLSLDMKDFTGPEKTAITDSIKALESGVIPYLGDVDKLLDIFEESE